MKRWLIVGGSIVAVVIAVSFAGLGGPPRYRYYGIDVELSVRGEVVTLGGEVECARTRTGINTGWQPTYGLARPSALATRIATGETVVVKTASFCLTGLPTDESSYTPSVFLIADGDPPARIEAYGDPIYLRDPASAVHVRDVSFTPLRGSAIGEFWRKERRPTAATDLVPWANAPEYQREHGPHWFYRGYMIDSIGFGNPAARVALARVNRRENGVTRIDYDTEHGRETLRLMQDHPSSHLGLEIDWADPGARCRRDPEDPLCRVLTRQRPLRFEADGVPHRIEIPDKAARGPLRMLPIPGGPPPRYLNKLGYSGDEEIGEKFPATLVVGDERLDMPHDFISKYTLALTIDWANERIFRVFMVEIDPSLFDDD